MDDNRIYPATEKLAVLLVMQHQPNRPFTVTDLAERLHYTSCCVQEILDALTESGLVAQTRMVSDGEIGYISLTSAINGEAKILLVEDNPINQKIGLLQLEKLGYQAEVVSNGREAVAAVLLGHYTLVLIDCQMPEMDGYEATGHIRQMESTTGNHIPIIAVTANVMPGDHQKCLAAGMDDYLPKPVRIEDLRAMLERWSMTAAT